MLVAEVYKKIVGMQMLVEGLAMGAFATLYTKTRDPLLRHLCQLVMTDEAFHHKFGKIWADRTIPKLSQGGAEMIEDWAAQCVPDAAVQSDPRRQKTAGLSRWSASTGMVAQASLMEAITDDHRRERMRKAPTSSAC